MVFLFQTYNTSTETKSNQSVMNTIVQGNIPFSISLRNRMIVPYEKNGIETNTQSRENRIYDLKSFEIAPASLVDWAKTNAPNEKVEVNVMYNLLPQNYFPERVVNNLVNSGDFQKIVDKQTQTQDKLNKDDDYTAKILGYMIRSGAIFQTTNEDNISKIKVYDASFGEKPIHCFSIYGGEPERLKSIFQKAIEYAQGKEALPYYKKDLGLVE